MEKIWGNLKKGLRFYCRENGFSDVILGLSGGLDSAVVSYTSALSLEIARELAEMNKFNYRVLDIQPLVDSQQKFLTAALGTEPKKVVVENLQARERGKILMAFSNQFGYLVLACGNRSEAATGYCTLYGDTCGGLMLSFTAFGK